MWISKPTLFAASTACIVGIFCVLGLLALRAPGLYMDAINPDYEIVKVLHPDAVASFWEAPGDFFLQRFPVMSSLYGGSYSVYWGLPFYVLFGGTILSVRLAHLAIGVVILIGVALLTRRLTRSATIASITTLLIAVDPSFVYVFRTQAYMEMISIIFVVACLYVIDRDPSRRGYFIAGAMTGLAAFGYFVYFFMVPGLLLFVTRDARADRKIAWLWFLFGLIVGVAPYYLAYGLMFEQLGLHEGVNWIRSSLTSLHVAPGDVSYMAKVGSVFSFVWYDLTNEWEWLTFFGISHDEPLETCKVALMLFVSFLALVTKSVNKDDRRAISLTAITSISFVVCATYFGSRLGAHDLVAVTFFSYITSAAAVALLLRTFGRFRGLSMIGVAACAIIVLLSNGIGTASVVTRLAQTGGAGLYSSFISELPEDALRSGEPTPYIFWSWGEMMPFIYETGGAIPALDGNQLGAALCRYGIVKVVLLGSDAAAPNLVGTFPLSGLKVVHSVLEHDSSSGFPYKLVTVEARHNSSDCLTAPSLARRPAGVEGANTTRSTSKPQQMLRLVAQFSKSGVLFQSIPEIVPIERDGALPVVSVHWKVPNSSKVEIHMGSPTGTLFTQGGSKGDAVTGPWVQVGVRFYLQDVTGGSPGKTVSVLQTAACANCIATKQ